MSLCYDFQKWTIISTLGVAIFLTIGLISFAYASQNQDYLGGFQLYNNSDYRFKVLYPQNWIITQANDKPGNFIEVVGVLEPLGEQGKHYTKKFSCGEVCLLITKDNSPEINGYSIDQYSEYSYNTIKKNSNGFKLLEYKTPSTYKIGDKKAFEILFQEKQGNREYIKKFIGIPNDENSFLRFEFKARDKYSGEIVPLMTTMTESIKFNENSTSSLKD